MKKNKEQNNENEILENDENLEQDRNKEIKVKKSFLGYVWSIIKYALIIAPIYFVIAYSFFMPHYQKQMIRNLMPFSSVQEIENQQLVNVIDKQKIVELPTKKAQNLAAFLEEFDKYESFQENPTYGNLLEIISEVELHTKLENRFIPNLIAKNYEEYINKKLFEESLLDNSNNSEIYTNDSNEETIIEIEE